MAGFKVIDFSPYNGEAPSNAWVSHAKVVWHALYGFGHGYRSSTLRLARDTQVGDFVPIELQLTIYLRPCTTHDIWGTHEVSSEYSAPFLLHANVWRVDVKVEEILERDLDQGRLKFTGKPSYLPEPLRSTVHPFLLQEVEETPLYGGKEFSGTIVPMFPWANHPDVQWELGLWQWICKRERWNAAHALRDRGAYSPRYDMHGGTRWPHFYRDLDQQNVEQFAQVPKQS